MAVQTVFGVGARRERGARLMPRGERAGGLAVDHIGGDSEHGLRGDRVPVQGDFLDFAHHGVHDGGGDIVGAVIVVAVDGEIAFGKVVHHKASFVAHGGDLRVFDCGERVGDNGQPGDAATHGAHDFGIVQRHFDCLVSVAVMAVVDDIKRFHIGAHDPIEHVFVFLPDFVEVEGAVAGDGGEAGDDLLAGNLVAAAVDCVEQGLCRIDAGAKELHLLADGHRGHAARNCGVVAPPASNLLVRFVLDRGGFNGDRGAEVLIPLG